MVDAAAGKVVVGPDLSARGFSDAPGTFDSVSKLVSDGLVDAMRTGMNDLTALQQLVRRTVGRWVNENYRRRPMIVPVVLEV